MYPKPTIRMKAALRTMIWTDDFVLRSSIHRDQRLKGIGAKIRDSKSGNIARKPITIQEESEPEKKSLRIKILDRQKSSKSPGPQSLPQCWAQCLEAHPSICSPSGPSSPQALPALRGCRSSVWEACLVSPSQTLCLCWQLAPQRRHLVLDRRSGSWVLGHPHH